MAQDARTQARQSENGKKKGDVWVVARRDGHCWTGSGWTKSWWEAEQHPGQGYDECFASSEKVRALTAERCIPTYLPAGC
jgi:hypothetical protein